MTRVLDTSIPRYLQDLVERELEPEEEIVWSGMPKPRFFTRNSTPAFLFAIPFTVFPCQMLCFVYSAAPFRFASMFLIFCVPFIMIGLALLSSPLWARRNAANTVYVITNRRVITFIGGWSTTIRSFPPEKLQHIYRIEHRDGTGDVIVANFAWRDKVGEKHAEALGLLRVWKPKEVEALVKELAASEAENLATHAT